MEQVRRYHTYPDTVTLQADLVRRIRDLANACIKGQGSFRIVLAGGSTPESVYRSLASIDTDWSAWHIYFGDERCLPAGDPGRNDTMVQEAWLKKVTIPEQHIHLIPAELGAKPGAQAYDHLLTGITDFDLVLLGLGEDGHTASLFPNHRHDDKARVIAVHDAPKPPAERISLSASAFSRSKQVWFIVSGENKRVALHQWHNGNSIPASTIQPRNGVDVFTELSVDAAPVP